MYLRVSFAMIFNETTPSGRLLRTDVLRRVSLLLLLVVLVVVVAAANQCPFNCTCLNGGTTVDCSRRNLKGVPFGLPNTTVTLNLTHNHISKLEAHAFSGLNALTTLDASFNNISTINNQTFQGCCSRLLTLVLTANKISSIPAIIFDSLPSLQSLHLSDNKLLELPQVGQNGSATLVELHVANNCLRSATFPKYYAASTGLRHITMSGNANIGQLRAGDFSSLKRCAVRMLYVSKCKITTIASGSLSDLTSLRFIDVSHNLLGDSGFWSLVNELASVRGLREIDASDILLGVSLSPHKLAPLGATSLRKLDLSKNSLMSIENCSFCNLTRLMHLNLASSRVYMLGSLSFHGLDSLAELRLGGNRLTALPAFPPSLKKLDLRKNQLEDLANNTFLWLTKLTWLNLRHNGLRATESGSFKDQSSLRWLDISHNKMPNFSPNVFLPLQNLTFLNLSYNNLQLQNSKEALFAAQKNLVTLDLSNNKMDAISLQNLTGLVSVKYLNLSNNKIGARLNYATPYKPVFMNAGSIEELDLSSNAIVKMPQPLFNNLKSLRTLRLSNNGFRSWDDLQLFDGDINLANLLLDGNKISVLNWTSFANLPGLRSVNLSRNPLACNCDMIWFRRWINDTSIVFTDLSTYTCQSPPVANGKPFLQFNPDDLACTEPPILIVALTFAGGFVSILIALTVVYKYRWRIRFRIYMACRRRVTSRRQRADGYECLAGRELLYTAYISYCRRLKCKSEILEHLLPRLDGRAFVAKVTASAASGGGSGFIVHIDEKFSPSSSIIESVVDAIDHSAVFIVFLCSHYRSNRLCELELDLAFTQSLFNGGYGDEESQRLPCIAVAYGDLSPRCIPRLLMPTFEKGAYWKWADDDETAQRLVVDVLRQRLNETGVFSKVPNCPDVVAAAVTSRYCGYPV